VPHLPFTPCLPTRATIVPHSDDWLHGIKYDGYRLIVHRDADRIRLITRGGYDLVWPLSVDRRGRPQNPKDTVRVRR